MALCEQWTRYGPGGINDWQFSGMVGTVGTLGGTTCLTGFPTDATQGIASITGSYAWEGSVYRWRTYSGTKSYVYMILGSTVTAGTGTALGFAVIGQKEYSWAQFVDGTVVATQSAGTPAEKPAWINIEVTLGTDGTWSAYWYGGTTGTCQYFPPFDRGSFGYIAIQNRLGSADDGPYGITEVEYPVILPSTMLDYVGTFNEGNNWGTIPMGTDVISAGPVSQRIHEPHMTTGWVSTVTVELDDTGSAWSDRVGYYSGANTSAASWQDGTWYLRQTWDDGATWSDIFQGYLPSSGVTDHYDRQSVTLAFQSLLGRYADLTVPYSPQWMGTVDSITDGTVVVTGTGTRPDLFLREHLWSGTGTSNPSVRIAGTFGTGGWSGADPYTGTFYVSTVPSWMIVGADVYRSESYGRWADGRISGPEVIGSMGLSGGLSRLQAVYVSMYTLEPNAVRYYGGEKWVTALSDWCAAVGASYTVGPEGTVDFFVPMPEVTVVGTITTDNALDVHYSRTYTTEYDRIIVNAAWNADEERYDAQIESGSGDKVMTIDAKWIGSDRYARALASRTRAMSPVRERMTLTYAGSMWGSYTPGDIWLIANSDVADSDTVSVITGKTYHYDTDMVDVELIEQRTQNIFTVGVSLVGGPDRVW